MDVGKVICTEDASFFEVLEIINNNGLGIAFITNKLDQMCGVLTDGDARRHILKGGKLSESIQHSFNRDFAFGTDEEDLDTHRARLSDKIKILPVLNKDRKVVRYIRNESRNFYPVMMPDLSGGNELTYLLEAFSSTWISSQGPYIERFEKDFAAFSEKKYGVAVSNGTVAIHLALEALGVGEGSEVILPDFTFGATINAVLHSRATPVLVDVDPIRWTISPAAIEAAITPRTRAILPVHIYGQPANMDEISAIAEKHNLLLVEDCAEAHGARFKNRSVGSFGDINTYSFFANKILTTGEGGMCVTDSYELYRRMRQLRDHGMSPDKRYWHDIVGYNYRMTNLQAALGCGQLERINEILAKRKTVEDLYAKYLSDSPYVSLQRHFNDSHKVNWLVCITVDRRDDLIRHLKANNIDARPFFYSLGEMPIFAKYLHSNTHSRALGRSGLNLPSDSQLRESDIKTICHTITSFYEKPLHA